MINAIRVVYKLISFLILFVLIGTFLIYIEEITLNQNSYIDESGIEQLGYTTKSNIPIIISLIISYIPVSYTHLRAHET